MDTPRNATSKPRMRAFKIFISAALAGLLVVTLLIHFHASLLLLAASTYLSGHGVSLLSLEEISIGRNTLSLQRATFLLPGSHEISTVRNLHATYSPGELITGRIGHLNINSIELHPADPPINNASESEWTFNIQEILLASPLQSLSIEHLLVTGYFSEASLKMQIDSERLNAELISDETNIQFNLVQSDEHTSAIELNGTINLSKLVTLSNQQHLQIPLLRQIDGKIDFTASARVETNNLNSEFDINFTSELQAGSQLSTVFHPSSDRNPILLEAYLDQPLSLNGSYQGRSKVTKIDSFIPEAHIKFNLQNSEFELHIQSSSTTLICEPGLICDTEQDFIVSVPTIDYDAINASGVSIHMQSNIVIAENTLEITLQENSRIDTQHVMMEGVHATDASFVVEGPVSIIRNGESDISISSNTLHLILPEISIAESSSHALITATDLEVTLPSALNSKPIINMSALLRNIGTDFLPVQLRSPEIKLDLSITGSSYGMEGTLTASQRLLLDFRVSFDHLLEAGNMEINTPSIVFIPELQPLSYFLFDIPIAADIITGSLQASSQLTLRRGMENSFQYSGTVSLAANNLSGYIAETAFVNLNTFLTGSLSESLDFTSGTDISLLIDSIDAGIPITDISLLYSIDTLSSQLTLKDLQASIFNGHIQSPHVLYNWGSQDNELILSLEGIDLSSMLSLAAYDAVEATGLVSGTIPVSIQGETSAVSVTNGTLYVEPPGGSIRYISPAQAGSNQTMALVNSALRNYQYDFMEATVNYMESGELDLGIRLQGISPDLNQGQRINLNLNISDNIPALLNSLQASRSITDILERTLENR